jgi:hypothetical protein
VSDAWTHTSRGKALDLASPKPGDIDIEEIAMALSNQCRYNGCVKKFYSVAEHSVLVCRWLRTRVNDSRCHLGGLLHDGAEAYTGDISWPMQVLLWGGSEPIAETKRRYELVKHRLEVLMCKQIGLHISYLHTALVREADLRILLDERRALLTEPPPRPWPIELLIEPLTPLGVDIHGWSPDESRRNFLSEIQTCLSAMRDLK